ncbi:MAG TPA: hypothetical protein VK826_20670 [Bacteroidia bacterium]|nr:hypothetical protein [Bacteroidia bacterium]
MKKKYKIQIERLDDIDVVFDPAPLTPKEKELLSAAIREMKEESSRKGKKKKPAA